MVILLGGCGLDPSTMRTLLPTTMRSPACTSRDRLICGWIALTGDGRSVSLIDRISLLIFHDTPGSANVQIAGPPALMTSISTAGTTVGDRPSRGRRMPNGSWVQKRDANRRRGLRL